MKRAVIVWLTCGICLAVPAIGCGDDGGTTDTGSDVGDGPGDETGDQPGDETGTDTGTDTGDETGTDTPTDPGDDDDECIEGEVKCDSSAGVLTCTDGAWELTEICEDPLICQNGACVEAGCEADCVGKACGDDGCGGSCGTCKPPLVCDPDGGGFCTSPPDECSCAGKECGDDGCGDSCGFCGDGETCDDGQCVEDGCTPDCDDAECGDDGCGGLCGTCGDGEYCDEGTCVEGECTPECGGNECGGDGCGGLCGTCGDDEACEDGQCVEVCTPECDDAECGDDGCGGECGVCDEGTYCDGGLCVEGECTPECGDSVCGDDGCGGECGTCGDGESCIEGACVEDGCTPDCDDAVCGDDGCGGSCGECVSGACVAGQCIGCIPQCGDAECGNDGCGGSCGECGDGTLCVEGLCVEDVTPGSGCDDLLDCLAPCETEACAEACLAAASAEAVQAYVAVLECFDGCEDNLCVAEQCADDFVACTLPEPGDGSCSDAATCFEACDPEDYGCNDACWSATSAAEATLLFQLETCLGQYCVGDDVECQALASADPELCGEYGLACFGDEPCDPSCEGVECGSDGCGGLCGVCVGGTVCVAGACVEDGGGDPSCEAYSNCLDDCVEPDGPCAAACTDGASAGAVATYGAMVDCFTGCLGEGTCVAESCTDELAACFFEDPGAVTCADTLDCLDGCGEDQTCGEACLDEATEDAAAQYLAIVYCLGAICPDGDPFCQQAAMTDPTLCGSYLDACLGDVGPCEPSCEGAVCGDDGCGGECGVCEAGTLCIDGLCEEVEGGLDCLGIDACASECAEADIPCINDCIALGSEPGAAQFSALGDCSASCPDMLCFADSCSDEVAACVWQTQGDAGCADLDTCLGECADGDEGCIDGCWEGSTFDAQTTYFNVIYCVQAYCFDGDPSCPEQVLSDPTLCGTVWTACMDDGGGPCEPDCTDAVCGSDGCGGTCGHCGDGELCAGGQCIEQGGGTLDCLGVDACFIDCLDDPTCEADCLAQGTAEGAAQYSALIACFDACEDTLCIAESCNDEAAACVWQTSGDAGCWDLNTCLNTCGDAGEACTDLCWESSDVVAQEHYYSLIWCVQFYCPEGDPGCQGAALDDPTQCGDLWSSCEGDQTSCIPAICETATCGTDGCGGECGHCGADSICLGGQCEATGGGLDCLAIDDCIGSCAIDDEGCTDACVDAGTLEDQAEYDALINCFDACDTNLCVAEDCAMELADCVFDETGAEDCASINACTNECPDGDDACLTDCWESGSLQAQTDLYEVIYCIDFYCIDGDVDCINTVLLDDSFCGLFWADCAGP